MKLAKAIVLCNDTDFNYWQVSDDGNLPLVPQDIQRHLQTFQQTPMERVLHYANTGNYIDQIYQSERLSDASVRIGDFTFAAHRVVLSCYSEYFADLFAKMNASMRIPLDIRLRGVSPEAFSVFMKFAYTGQVSINPELVADIMKMSENLRISTLRSKCLDYMEILPCNDVLLLLANFKESQESEIFVRAMTCVSEKFLDSTSCDIFLLLDIETVCIILSYDHLFECTEMEIFKAGLRWIEFKIAERAKYMERIMGCIRFTLMTMDELFLVVKATRLISDNPRCMDILLRANW